MQNDNQVVIKEMLKSFAYLLDEALKTTTKSYDGIIVSATSNSKKWNVKYNNEIHAVKMYGVGTPTANMMVKVIIPQGNQALAWFFIPGSSGGSGDGATFIPNVSESGIISWTNDKNLPNPEPVNIKGPQGNTGDIGPQGPKGDVGETGPYFIPSVSQNGIISWTNNGGLENPNEVNIKGPQGDVGPQGPTGPEGLQGPQGAQGPIGETGPYFTPTVNINGDLSWENNGGLPNPQTINIRGPQGIQGPTGEKGEQGEIGPIGPTGPQGPRGEQGISGEQGMPGEKGDTGPYFTPFVSSEGIISWTNNGGLDNPTSVSIKGPQGETGPKGDTGDIGPQGSIGPTGPQGEPGYFFTPNLSPTGELSWTNNGNLQNPSTVNIMGPQGIQGIQGPQGIQGETGATGPQGPIGPSGADATINGVNVLTIQGQNGIQVTQTGDVLTVQGEGFVFNPVGTQGQLLGFVQDNVIGAITGEYVALNKDGIRRIGYFTPIS